MSKPYINKQKTIPIRNDAEFFINKPIRSRKPVLMWGERAGVLKRIEYRDEDKLHRLDGPAITSCYSNGNVEIEEYWVNGAIHRSGGPAVICYYLNGNIKREEYWVDNKIIRQSGPAVIEYYENGITKKEEYWVNNKKHRLKGPAEIYYYENVNIKKEEFWINGGKIVKEQFDIDFEGWPLSLEDQTLLQLSL